MTSLRNILRYFILLHLTSVPFHWGVRQTKAISAGVCSQSITMLSMEVHGIVPDSFWYQSRIWAVLQSAIFTPGNQIQDPRSRSSFWTCFMFSINSFHPHFFASNVSFCLCITNQRWQWSEPLSGYPWSPCFVPPFQRMARRGQTLLTSLVCLAVWQGTSAKNPRACGAVKLAAGGEIRKFEISRHQRICQSLPMKVYYGLLIITHAQGTVLTSGILASFSACGYHLRA